VPAVQISRSQLCVLGEVRDLAALSEQFRATHRIHLPGFIAPDLWQLTQHALATATYDTKVHHDTHPPAVVLTLRQPTLLAAYLLALNDPGMLRLVERLTGIHPLGSFIGDFYRMDPGVHHTAWHNDVDGARAVAISINVSSNPFEGGELSMRQRGSDRPMWTFSNQGRGDAILFRIREDLEHRIHEVTGSSAKCAVTGWFLRRG
jgi:hypothetical protein